jgi:hypothetical protein
VRPEPNSSFGLSLKLVIAGQCSKKTKGFQYWLKTKWRSPIYYSKVDLEYNKGFTKTSAENQGYFNNTLHQFNFLP